MQHDDANMPEAFKALGDPIRWAILQQIAAQPELAGSTLEDSLPVSRPTISYHIRILAQADLIEMTKRGRNHYYSLRRDVLRDLMTALEALLPGLALVPNEPAAGAPPEPGLPAAGAEERPTGSSTDALPTW
ncbi:metalloregulator ArsR/SmtB family transcription factor [Nocardioides sp. YIM 152588]|uniref:ArsR/SmtB family transcription factor n=1 Tax=Nocardioides sp. YIM 152588 TaxID=3158259 RepID=UPI0032E3B151